MTEASHHPSGKSERSTRAICPCCFSYMHAGAEVCPHCRYQLSRAEEVFTAEKVRFRRVHDVAGVFCNEEYADLTHYLEKLERRLPPVVLSVYITGCGNPDFLCVLAHWLLNHAEVDDVSFGLRQKSKLLSEKSVSVEAPGEPRKAAPAETGNALQRAVRRVSNALLDRSHPLPPPVDPRWFLILVMDVNQSAACFCWGYMLDPYVDTMRINSAIMKGMLQFRERSMSAAIKKVMKEAVIQIAKRSHLVHKAADRRSRAAGLSGLLLFPALLTAHAVSPASAAVTTPPARTAPQEEDLVAEEIPEATAEEVPEAAEDDAVAEAVEETPTPPAPQPVPQPDTQQQPAAAGSDRMPRWTPADYSMLMDGRLADSFAALFPAQPASTTKRTEARVNKTPRRNAAAEQSDLLRRYHDHFRLRDSNSSALCDPIGLLSAPEADDVDYVLRHTNAASSFRIYVVMVRGSDSIPTELSAPAITHALVPTYEHSVVIRYTPGAPDFIDLGYCNIPGDEAQREARRNAVRKAAIAAGDRVEGILAAIRSVHAQLLPLSAGFVTPKDGANTKPPVIDIPMAPKEKVKKKGFREKLEAMVEDPETCRLLSITAAVLLILSVLVLRFIYLSHCGKLRESTPDVRLGSPHGAGVCRSMRYLTGYVIKTTPIFPSSPSAGGGNRGD